MEKKEVVFICQVTRQLCVDILNGFAANGASVTVYTGEISNTQTLLDPNVTVCYLCKYSKATSFKRIFTWTWFTIQVFFKLLFRNKKGQLVFVTTPPFIPFLGLFFKAIFNQPYHLVMWDIYPDALLSMFSESGFVFRKWAKFNNALLNKAQTVITLGHYMAKTLKKYSGNKIEPLIIHNWADLSFIKPKPKEENWFAKQYNQVDKFTILYSGNMGDTHDFDSLLLAAEALIQYRDINFILIGEGARKKHISSIISSKKLTNVILLGFQESNVFPFSITTGDIGVVALDEGMEYVSLPSKTYSILAAGNALLALSSKDSELGRMIEEYQCGKVCEKGDSSGVEKFILELYNDKKALSLLKANARQAAYNFTPENALLYYKYICK